MAKYLISFSSAAMVVPEGESARRPSRGPRASRRPVVVTKSYASSGSTRSPEGSTETGKCGLTLHSLQIITGTPHHAKSTQAFKSSFWFFTGCYLNGADRLHQRREHDCSD